MFLTRDMVRELNPRARRPTSNGLNFAFMALLLGAVVHASVQSPGPVDLESSGARLESDAVASRFERPGRYRWDLEASVEGDLRIMVNRARQELVVLQGGHEIAWSRISTGRPGYETPAGEFRILQKKLDHVSSIYRAAEMPYMQRVNRDGIAIHGGIVPRLPASRGCIRVPHAFARFLFSVTDIGSEVLVR